MIPANNKIISDFVSEFGEKYGKGVPAITAALAESMRDRLEEDPDLARVLISCSTTIVNTSNNTEERDMYQNAYDTLPEDAKKVIKPEAIHGVGIMFLLYVVLKNLEHHGIIKIFSKGERVAQEVWKNSQDKLK